jgi:hypothetical protein
VIDSSCEALVSLAEAAALLPRRRRGRKPHVSTLYRWASTGVRGVVLETLQVGGTRCTSAEALQRFFEALSIRASPQANVGTQNLTCRVRSVTERHRAAGRAGELLERSGA